MVTELITVASGYPPRMFRALIVATLLLLASECEPDVPEGRFDCDTDADCPPGQVCAPANDRCYTPDGS